MLKTKTIFVLVIIFGSLNLYSQIDTVKVNIENENVIYIKNNFIKFYTDQTNLLNADDVKTLKYDTLFVCPDIISIYKKNTNIWFKFYVKNESDKSGQWIVAIPNFGFIEYYITDESGISEFYKAGTKQAVSQKQIRNDRLELISVTLDSNQTKTFYVKANSDVALKIQDLFIVQPIHSFYHSINISNFIQGIFSGFLLVLFLYNLILFVMTRQKSYIFYSLYILFINISGLALYRYFQILLFPENPDINNQLGFSAFFAFIFYFLFIREFIDTKLYNLKLDKYLKRLVLFNSILTFLLIFISFFNYFIYALFALLSVIVNMFLILYTAVKIIIKGGYLSKIFALGTFFLISGTLIAAVSHLLGVNEIFILVIFEIGVVVEALIFTIGLGYKYKLAEDNVIKVQADLIEQYKENDLLKTKVNRELEEKVEERTSVISKQKDTINALYQEMHHRVKNNLQKISSLIYINLDFIENKEQQDILREMDLKLNTMALVHEMLYSKSDFGSIPLKEYINELVISIENTLNSNNIPINYIFDIQEIKLNINNSINLGMFTNEAITNSIKYAFKNIEKPEIKISLILKEENYIFSIKDNGIGIEQNKMNKENSLGMKLFDIFARQLDAKLEIISENGTEVKLIIPVENLL